MVPFHGSILDDMKSFSLAMRMRFHALQSQSDIPCLLGLKLYDVDVGFLQKLISVLRRFTCEIKRYLAMQELLS